MIYHGTDARQHGIIVLYNNNNNNNNNNNDDDNDNDGDGDGDGDGNGNGAITCVSSLYTGSISDKEITRCSGILDLLEAHDSVMADKGFDIEDLLRSKQVSLNLPPFLQSHTQFSAQDVLQAKAIAKVRIHVERAIRRIKEFQLFDSDISLSRYTGFCQSTVYGWLFVD